jgi:hypothetical protein
MWLSADVQSKAKGFQDSQKQSQNEVATAEGHISKIETVMKSVR